MRLEGDTMSLTWWQQMVCYQIYPRSFKDSNNDGIGDINGIIEKLDYLSYLGIDAIWLSPVYQSPNDDYGYDISNYYDINSEYGTLDDMKRLISEAKKRNIKIIMDLVMNHTSDMHPWFIESKDPNSKYRDYYIYKEGKNGKVPNNWTGFFGGTVWEKTERGDYFLHLFSSRQPDLNFKNRQVIEEFKKMMAFWLDLGVFGFRCDVCNVFYKKSLDNGRPRLVLKGIEHYHQTKENHEILQTLKTSFKDHYDLMMVGETVLINTQMANDLINPKKELDLVFSFEHMETDQWNNKWFKRQFKPQKFIDVIKKWQTEVDWNANYFENHDQPRSVFRFGNHKHHYHSATMLSTLLLSLRGTPFIFQGQEIGMTNFDFISLDQIKDTESHRIYKVGKKLHIPKKKLFKMIKTSSRDNARTPMQWDDRDGFSSHQPWLSMNPNHKDINVENQLNQDKSVLKYYKEMIELRKHNHTLLEGKIKFIKSKKGVIVFDRIKDKEKLRVVVNMTSKRISMKNNDGSILINNYDGLVTDKLLPYQAVILGGLE